MGRVVEFASMVYQCISAKLGVVRPLFVFPVRPLLIVDIRNLLAANPRCSWMGSQCGKISMHFFCGRRGARGPTGRSECTAGVKEVIWFGVLFLTHFVH